MQSLHSAIGQLKFNLQEGCGENQKERISFMHFTVSFLLSEKTQLNYKQFNLSTCVIPNQVCVNSAGVKNRREILVERSTGPV